MDYKRKQAYYRNYRESSIEHSPRRGEPYWTQDGRAYRRDQQGMIRRLKEADLTKKTPEDEKKAIREYLDNNMIERHKAVQE